ncbi:MAG: NADP-dependent malic enzyme [Alphaproteobacteria bacterium]|uniref:NADP-dependent malic enzyme n=1 Tax=Hyphomonas sp. TaxID=87 RepID=UPI001D9994A9|nr:NADP-dependent malic enzyme [Alphaproteobacteria bacterium]MBU2082572.1 NADP-dependent malic enzyme [Alphaproteobacteria bacterium]MBU2142788.1 NADP-dependent malic enzyme [Alphaproteobacteria bacterium]MBU2195210.1 NADP-dependent malic enzyme [Alphaproteobacteria bacterium]
MTTKRPSFTDQEALDFHSKPTPGKISMAPTKPMGTQRDLSLAYSPGVAIPVLAIAEDPDKAYDYTSKGNMVAVISNGTAILGLGNLGHMASKPVMEGKSVLFKRFADIDSIDVEVNTTDAEDFIRTVRNIGDTWGGINLEDIGSPDCFIIESRLREELDIPVFHDDQHGTAIIAAAGIINACHITGRELKDLKVAVSGAGAAGLSVAGLIRHLGVKAENILMCDSTGVVYEGRTDKMDQFKSAFAVKTSKRTLAEACEGADCLLGLSAKGAVSKAMVKSMAKNPIIFAMANPDPEITPEEIKSVRDDAIIATGRSDYPNQVNNVLGFPYIFRGALDVRARSINEEMKVAAARALAELAREDVPDEVAAAYHGARPTFGREYIIPTPFDPRLISFIPPFVAQAAMDTGVARKPIADMDAYRASLAQRADPAAAFIQGVQARARDVQRRIVFAEGEEPAVVRAAFSFKNQGLGHPILIGREAQVERTMEQMGVPAGTLEIINARLSDNNPIYTDFLYARLQRDGYLKRDVQRLVNQDRNIFGCCMLKNGDADGMVTGVTRNYDVALSDSRLVLDTLPGQALIGMSMVINRGRTVFIADTSVTELPQGDDLANIALEAAAAVRAMGFVPRVAFLSYSTFGNPMGERGEKVREAVAILDEMGDVDFEYEGDMNADIALNPSHSALYPFSRLKGPANVLVMPAIHAASISTKLLESMSRATVIGPMLLGLEKPVQIASLGATVGDIVNLATIAAYDVDRVHPDQA